MLSEKLRPWEEEYRRSTVEIIPQKTKKNINIFFSVLWVARCIVFLTGSNQLKWKKDIFSRTIALESRYHHLEETFKFLFHFHTFALLFQLAIITLLELSYHRSLKHFGDLARCYHDNWNHLDSFPWISTSQVSVIKSINTSTRYG